MKFAKFLMIGAFLTALCGTLPGAEAAKTKFSYRANERERLRQIQAALANIKRMMQRSYRDQSVVDELDKFAESAIRKYSLHLSIEEIRHHGKLVKIMNRDRETCEKAKANKFVIDGMRYGKRCWNCNGAVKCTYCYGTGQCTRCKGSGKIDFAGKDEPCVQCNGTGHCPKCLGEPAQLSTEAGRKVWVWVFDDGMLLVDRVGRAMLLAYYSAFGLRAYKPINRYRANPRYSFFNLDD